MAGNGREKCSEPRGRPCKDGRVGGKNKRGGCGEPAGRPCGTKNAPKSAPKSAPKRAPKTSRCSPCPKKGSQAAKDKMASLRAMRGRGSMSYDQVGGLKRM